MWNAGNPVCIICEAAATDMHHVLEYITPEHVRTTGRTHRLVSLSNMKKCQDIFMRITTSITSQFERLYLMRHCGPKVWLLGCKERQNLVKHQFYLPFKLHFLFARALHFDCTPIMCIKKVILLHCLWHIACSHCYLSYLPPNAIYHWQVFGMCPFYLKFVTLYMNT